MSKSDIKEREGRKMVLLAETPAGPVERIKLKKRHRSVYYRPFKNEDGTVSWIPTLPLPSDALGRELYLGKGFRLKPPNEDAVAPEPLVDSEKESLYKEIKELRALLEKSHGKYKVKKVSE